MPDVSVAEYEDSAIAIGMKPDTDPVMLAWSMLILREAKSGQPRGVTARRYSVNAEAALKFLRDPDGFAAGIVQWAQYAGADGLRAHAIWPGGCMGFHMAACRTMDPDPWDPEDVDWRKRLPVRRCGDAVVRYFDPPDRIALGLLEAFAAIQEEPKVRRRRHPPREIGIISVNEGEPVIATRQLPKLGKLCKENYSPGVAEAFSDLGAFVQGKTSPERGRLAIIDGPPGTGKTYYIRGLIQKFGAPYLLASGNLVSGLSTPSFVAFILEQCEENNGLTLILEDADDAICRRDHAHQNLSLLSTLLNATSGILGDILNLRVLATVNVWDDDRVDEAVVRPGRLYRRVHIGNLDLLAARRIILNLTQGDKEKAARASAGMSLAQCYEIAEAAEPAAATGDDADDADGQSW